MYMVRFSTLNITHPPTYILKLQYFGCWFLSIFRQKGTPNLIGLSERAIVPCKFGGLPWMYSGRELSHIHSKAISVGPYKETLLQITL
jgi:hypothetical protein